MEVTDFPLNSVVSSIVFPVTGSVSAIAQTRLPNICCVLVAQSSGLLPNWPMGNNLAVASLGPVIKLSASLASLRSMPRVERRFFYGTACKSLL